MASASRQDDVFASDKEGTAVGPSGFIHIRVQTRRGKKKVTSITGLSIVVDLKLVLQRLIKVLSIPSKYFLILYHLLIFSVSYAAPEELLWMCDRPPFIVL
jgi:hypothetical protein